MEAEMTIHRPATQPEPATPAGQPELVAAPAVSGSRPPAAPAPRPGPAAPPTRLSAPESDSPADQIADELDPEARPDRRRMRVLVDLNRCLGYAQCVFLAPEVFELIGDEMLRYEPNPDPAQRRRVLRAAAACPVRAIVIDRLDDAEQGTAP
jgi:ferredoxin